VPEDLDLGPDDAVTEAQRLLDADLPFPAHEVLEGVWKTAPAAERELWRALAQVAVGLTHAQRGNPRGALALLIRAADGLGRWVDPAPAGLDVDGVRARAEELAHHIEESGLQGLTAADLRVRLRSDGRREDAVVIGR
jgi:predicted metal-dependent hydrolase